MIKVKELRQMLTQVNPEYDVGITLDSAGTRSWEGLRQMEVHSDEKRILLNVDRYTYADANDGTPKICDADGKSIWAPEMEEFADWGDGILKREDLDYLSVLNEITDILMLGVEPAVVKRLEDIEMYLVDYGKPDGFNDRYFQWKENEKKEGDVNASKSK